jgi:hypothetical protein
LAKISILDLYCSVQQRVGWGWRITKPEAEQVHIQQAWDIFLLFTFFVFLFFWFIFVLPKQHSPSLHTRLHLLPESVCSEIESLLVLLFHFALCCCSSLRFGQNDLLNALYARMVGATKTKLLCNQKKRNGNFQKFINTYTWCWNKMKWKKHIKNVQKYLKEKVKLVICYSGQTKLWQRIITT